MAMSMLSAPPQVFTTETVVGLSPQRIAQMLQSQAATIAALQQQLEWFKRQIFGKKSERFAPMPDAQQMHLGQVLGELAVPPEQPVPASTVPAHTRRKPNRDLTDDGASGRIFGFEGQGNFWVPMFQFELRDLSIRQAPRTVRVERGGRV